MRVIIIGAGKIGYHVAEVLVQENHDVVVIENDEERAKALEEELDIQVIYGSGSSVSSLQEAGVDEAGLLVAVTESDEVNMISCILAKQYGVRKTVARVRNPEYIADEKNKEGLFAKIDLLINPELVTAREIVKVIHFPEALDVEYFASGQVQLAEIRIPPEAPIAQKQLKELGLGFPCIIAAILRKEKMMIPHGNDIIQPNDIIFIMSRTRDFRVDQLLGSEKRKPQKVMILGGDQISYYLAKLLEKRRIAVKIIEKNYDRCAEIANKLENVLVLHGDGTDIDLLKEEGAGDTDVFVCLTDDDKLNLLVSLLAKHLGTKRTIAQVRRSDYIRLMESVGIDVGVSPRLLTANAILRFVKRGRNIISATLLSEARAEMLELVVPGKAKIANKMLKDINLPQQAIIGSINRNKQVIIPTGADYIYPGDILTVFCLAAYVNKIEEYFNR